MLRPHLGGQLGMRRGDEAVRDTNDDAQLSKLSCVRLGYFQDSFVHHFVRRPTRRSPLINRGYYSRYAALRSLLLRFLAIGLGGLGSGTSGGSSERRGGSIGAGAAWQQGHQAQQDGQQPAQASQQQEQQQQGGRQDGQHQQAQEGQQQQQQSHEQQAAPPSGQGRSAGARQPRQVVVLGAGYDTTFFQLAAEGVRADKYVELDFLQVTQKKAAAIQQLPDLLACLGAGADGAAPITPEEGRVLTDGYCLLPADLRDLSQLEAALKLAGLDPSAPTLVLSECVLVYLQPQHSRDVVRWLADQLQTAAMVVYEQIQPHDAFGQQMLLNLESRGCPLLGIEATPSLDAHKRRFTECGWHRAEAHDMDHVYSHCIDPADRRRIERLEIFDEFEEWHLIQQHYCIAMGVKDSSGLLAGFGLPHYNPPAGAGGPPGRAYPPPPPPRFMA